MVSGDGDMQSGREVAPASDREVDHNIVMQSDCGVTDVPVKSVTLAEFLSESVLSSLSPSSQEYILLKQFIALCPTSVNDNVIGSGIIPVSLPDDPLEIDGNVLSENIGNQQHNVENRECSGTESNGNVSADVHQQNDKQSNHKDAPVSDCEVEAVLDGERDVQSIHNKRSFCVFCDKPYMKLKQHMISQHSDTTEVEEMVSKSGQDLQKYLLCLRNLGNHKHNCDILKSGSRNGRLVVAYTPKEGQVFANSAEKYVPCPYCYGYYEKQQLWRHCKDRCVWRPEERCDEKRSVMDKGRMLLPLPNCVRSQTQEILSHMRHDEVYRTAINDPLIMQFAHRLTRKLYSVASDEITVDVNEGNYLTAIPWQQT